MSSDDHPNRDVTENAPTNPQLPDHIDLQLWHSHTKKHVLDLDKPMKDGEIDPEWRPPPSENRVPYLKSYRPFEPWVAQENRRRAENLPEYEAAAREWEDQGGNSQGYNRPTRKSMSLKRIGAQAVSEFAFQSTSLCKRLDKFRG
ncbi:hypothetical protein N7471_000106 [Penicillium samsonianum]|uniref:uncharacterized protein n=1 Tax=Penicillium samsonianum TaxID=1882272 RepID=UPI002548AC9C|nr:uncharacterized protein N7471_000106 [Penicillium samsonianum]KAJ6148907.1 hypothetical protein N7471_000106 [Penicillium samsonianum]